jgi:hypothetical protein
MQPYTSTDGRFTVNFPQGEVKQGSQTVTLQRGDATTVHQFLLAQSDGASYLVMYNDYPAAYVTGDPQTELAAARDGVTNGKTLLLDTMIGLNGVPGREFTAKDDNRNYTVRQYLQGQRLYQLIVVSNSSSPAAQISDFMTSFKIQ